MKVFIACLGTETNTFTSMPTGMATFAENMLYHGDATAHPATTFSLPLHIWKRRTLEHQGQVVESVAAFAQPGGPTTTATYETLLGELLDDLKAAAPVDVVLLSMHGAMVSDQCDDCEGDILERVRAIVGPDAVIGAELDLHCSITEKMTGNADALVLFKEYPHIDVGERAEELFEICRRAHQGEVKPVMAVHDCRMINMWRTPIEPMKTVVAEMQAAEGRDGVLSVSFAHGFPWGDVRDASAKMVVIADGDVGVAATTAQRFGERLWSLRHETAKEMMSVDAALDRVAAVETGPLVLADVADNAGGGAPSDSTFMLQAVLARGLTGVLTGYYWDPVAVRFCVEAGEGARLDLRVGGKCGPSSGAPVDLTVTIVRIVEEARQSFGDATMPMGTAVLVRTESGVDLVLTSKRTQVFHPNGFEQLGVDLSAYRAVIVKSIQHFYAGFAPIAAEVLYVSADGAIPPTFAEIPYKKFTDPYWPRVENPF